jgi:hypothetical protein
MTLQFCSFFLLGTLDPANHAVGDSGTGAPTLVYFQNSCILGATKIQTGITKVSAAALN